MIGINKDNLGKLIKVNNLNLDSLSKNLDNLVGVLDDLDECFSGSGILFAFSETINQKDNLKKVPQIISNYSDILSSVKISYERQDANFQSLFNQSDIQ